MEEQRRFKMCEYVNYFTQAYLRKQLDRALEDCACDHVVAIPHKPYMVDWAEEWAQENDATLTYGGSRTEEGVCDFLYFRVQRRPLA